jgi:hypothetical protein
MIKSVLSLE